MKYSTYIKPRKRSLVEVILPKSFYLKRIKIFLLSLIPIVIIGAVLYVFYITLFKSSILNLEKDKIEINGVGTFVDERIFRDKVYSYVLGKNISKLDIPQLEKTLLVDFPSLKTLNITKRVPPYLILNVQERIPFFAVYKEDANDSYMIAADGFVIDKFNDKYKDLFKVQYSGDIKIGDFIDADIIILYQDILEKIDEVDLSLDHIVFDKDSSVVYLSNDVIVTLLNKKGIQDSFKIVSSILDKLNKEDRKVSKIDLRYEKVIVSYN